MWKEYCRVRQATEYHKGRHMNFALRITTATNTHLEYVRRIPFPQQQWLHERASILHFMHIACPVLVLVCSLGHAYSSCAVWSIVFHKLHNSVLVIHFLRGIRVIFIPRIHSDSLVSIHDRSLFLIKSKGHASFSCVGPLLHLHTLQKFIVD
jgi:hypothetical protein